MAERPIFIPWPSGLRLVKELSFDFKWSPGFAPIQKKKNVVALHEAAKAKGYFPLLEVSTKSEVVLGQRLSAFNLKVKSETLGEVHWNVHCRVARFLKMEGHILISIRWHA